MYFSGPDVQRILDLPEVDYEEDAVAHTERYHRLHRKRLFDNEGDPVALLRKQAAALRAIETRPYGIIAPLLPGDGKTLIGALGPGHAEAVGRVKKAKPLLVVPAKLRKKTFAEYVEYGKDWKIVAPYVVSYALLSRRPYLLDRGGYNVFVFDEAHKLKDIKSARTKRVLTALQENLDVLVILMTASFYGEGLHHSAHWLDAILREDTPIPLRADKRRAWGRVLDIKTPDHEAWPWLTEMEGLRQKYAPELKGRDAYRAAFARRMAKAPGIVCSRPNPEDMVAASLILGVETDLELSQTCLDAIKTVLETGERPDGEVLPDPARTWQCARNLSSGFYYRWIWPNGIPDIEWLDARRRWNKLVRGELDGEHVKGYDTEALVVGKIQRGEAPELLSAVHERWMREKRRVNKGKDPPKEPVWIDREVPRRMVELAERFDKPVILWVESDALQRALVEDGVVLYRDGAEPPSKPESFVCAMSWRSHGEGRNLQAWDRCLVVEPPGGAPVWEQLLARTHRRGQRSDEVIFGTLAHTMPLSKKLIEAAQGAHALAIQDGVPQRLDFCDKIDLAEVLTKPKRRK